MLTICKAYDVFVHNLGPFSHCFCILICLFLWLYVDVRVIRRSISFAFFMGNASRHFRAVERPLSGRGSVDQSEATEHWRFPGLFGVMRFISSRNTNGPENQVGLAGENENALTIKTRHFVAGESSVQTTHLFTPARLFTAGFARVTNAHWV